MVENASKLSFFYFSIGIQSVRLTPTVRGIGARLELNSSMLFGRLVSGGKC